MRSKKQLVQRINEEIFKNLDLVIEFAAAKLYFVWHILQMDDSDERISSYPFTEMCDSLPIDLGQVLKSAFFEIQKEVISKYFSKAEDRETFYRKDGCLKEEADSGILKILGEETIANRTSEDIFEEMASYFSVFPTLSAFLKKGEAVGSEMLHSFERMREKDELDLDIVDPTFSYFLKLYEKRMHWKEK